MVSQTQSSNLNVRDAVRGPDGYSTALRFQPEDLARVKSLIESQWLECIGRHAPQAVDDFASRGIDRYHECAEQVDHGSIWPKSSRILPAAAVAEIRAMPFFDRLREQFGKIVVSDEEEVGWEELYWRLVRPGQPGDIGPLHADAWFWELGHGATPPGTERVKVWIAIVTEPELSGLRVVPGSHLREWRYHGEHRHGFVKPVIDEDEKDLNPQLVPMNPGDAIVFHDRLLHGGALNQGQLTRVSLEFTMFVKA